MSENVVSVEETLEESSKTRKILEDIGGQANLTLFYSLLKDYKENSAQFEQKFLLFKNLIVETKFDYAYCVKNTYLFVKFMDQSPKYREAVWFMQAYARIKLEQNKFDFIEIMYVHGEIK